MGSSAALLHISTQLSRPLILTGMSSDVSLQQPGTGEGFAAQLAFARKRVRANVHLKRAQRHVGLLAILARESLFDLR